MADQPSSTCIIPGCGGEVHARGLCVRDYIAATRLIASGQTTWSELEAYGIVRPARQLKKRGATVKKLLKQSRRVGVMIPTTLAVHSSPLFSHALDVLPGH